MRSTLIAPRTGKQVGNNVAGTNCYRVRHGADGWSVEFNDDPIALFGNHDDALAHARAIGAVLARTIHQRVCVCCDDGPIGTVKFEFTG